jgi:hypothetical protein
MSKNNPIVVGGVGGSGTRLVAQILIEAGVFIGDDLGSANDNLTFTFFFKRPPAFKSGSKNWIKSNLRVFERYMLGEPFRPQDFWTLALAYYGESYQSTYYDPEFHKERTKRIWQARRGRTGITGKRWGWKEPNSHIFLEHLAAHFPQMRYVHVIRHGLDMAFSNNAQQLQNWGDLFGVTWPAEASQLPQAQLE